MTCRLEHPKSDFIISRILKKSFFRTSLARISHAGACALRRDGLARHLRLVRHAVHHRAPHVVLLIHHVAQLALRARARSADRGPRVRQYLPPTPRRKSAWWTIVKSGAYTLKRISKYTLPDRT